MKSNPLPAGSTGRAGKAFLFLLLFAVVGVLVFHALWHPGAILMPTDDNVGLLKGNQRMLEASVLHPWNGEVLWGLPGMSMVRPGYYLLKAVPAEWFMNTFHGLCLTLSAWLLALYLRDKGLRAAACVFGGLAAFWVGTNLTLVHAGHVGKYGTMVFLSLSIFSLGRWGKTGRMAWSVVAGAAAGGMFLEQADVALFCALLLVPLGLFEASRAAGGWKAAAIVKQSWVAALAALLLAGGASLAARGSGVTEMTDSQTPEERWDYITQWSQPPSESLDFIAPGWTGWSSGDSEGPYWGKMGRSAGWEQTRQGFMNFKLENVYVGVIPLLFALIGLAEAFRRRREEANAAAVFLWGGLCLAALLLSFGKFFPVYRLLSLLPGFSSIRNPNKFIHFFQIAWGVLAAFGLDAALRMERPAARRWLWGAGAGGFVFLLAGLALWADLGSGASQLALAGWGPMGRVIQWNKAFSVTYAGGALLAGAGILWLLSLSGSRVEETPVLPQGKKGKKAPVQKAAAPLPRKSELAQLAALAIWLPALAVVFDASVILAPHYIKTMPPGFVAENEVTRQLKEEIGPNRVGMATQDGFYNLWLTYLFPYQGIPSVNVTQLPRPPADYTAFWSAIKDPVRSWQLSAVSHVLAHSPIAAQLMANPAWAEKLEVGWTYQPVPLDEGRGGVTTRRVPADQQAQETVLRLKPTPPRVAAISSWREVTDDLALRTLADPAFVPFSTVLLAPDSGVGAPPSPAKASVPATVEIIRLIPGRYEFTVEHSVPVVVRVAEKFDPGWKATVDGEPVPVLRTDFMFQGVFLAEPGRQTIVLRNAPSSLPLVLQGAGLFAGLAAALWLLLPRRRKAATA